MHELSPSGARAGLIWINGTCVLARAQSLQHLNTHIKRFSHLAAEPEIDFRLIFSLDTSRSILCASA